jgi:dynactin-6
MTTAATALPTPPSSSSFPFLTLGVGCVVCSESVIEGPFGVSIGAGSVVHPRATICARFGPVVIGANCVVEEFACIRAPADSAEGIEIGNMNLLRVGCVVEASLGSGNLVDCRARVPAGTGLGSGCVVGPAITIDAPLTDGTILYGSASTANIAQRRRADQFAANIEDIKPKEILREMLSKTHRILH